MKIDQLVDILTKHGGAKKDGAAYLMPDAHLSLYVGFPGETLVVAKVQRVEVHEPFVHLETSRGERVIVAPEDVRAAKFELAEGAAKRDRGAGFGR